MVEIDNLPAVLKEECLFCCWRYEDRNGKRTKVPYNPKTGGRAQSTNPDTFAPLSVAMNALERGSYDGIGVGIFWDVGAIDIDHCVTESGELSPLAFDVMDAVQGYTEFSPSKTGLRILFKATGFLYDKARYYINNQKLGLEVYIAGGTNKFVTVTGDALTPGFNLEERGEQLAAVLEKYMVRPQVKKPTPSAPSGGVVDMDDQALIEKAKRGRNGAQFTALWNGDTTGYQSKSEADIALCNMLAFWTNRDAERIDRLFRASGLMRDKWDRRQSGSTYGALTIQNAVNSTGTGYDPQAHFQRKAGRITVKTTAGQIKLADLHPDKNDRYEWSDIGNGNLFADWYKERARYSPERKRWFIYNGKVWEPDAGNLRAMELCKKLADDLTIYALSIPDERQRNEYLDFVRRWQRRNYRETVLKDAASVYPVRLDDFDRDPFLFNCINGTLDLRNGYFRPHSPADMLSKLSGVEYDAEAKCERWERHIEEVMEGSTGKALFLQKAMGYTLTGDTQHECFFVLYGPTSRNGKGVTMETFMKLMGDYGRTAKPDSIAQKQTTNSNGPSEDIARLAGARFVNISEPDKKLVLSSALVKTLTGRDKITARFLNENSFEYYPQFKLFISTNYLPTCTDITLFSSDRVKIIPFEHHFTEAERDTGLKAELSKPENLSGILNWCFEGLRMIEETGFDAPEEVVAATVEYRKNSDKIGRFVDEEMEPEPLAETRTGEIYPRYKAWCERNGFFPENAANFKSSLANIATVTKRRPSGSSRNVNAVSLLLGYRFR